MEFDINSSGKPKEAYILRIKIKEKCFELPLILFTNFLVFCAVVALAYNAGHYDSLQYQEMCKNCACTGIVTAQDIENMKINENETLFYIPPANNSEKKNHNYK